MNVLFKKPLVSEHVILHKFYNVVRLRQGDVYAAA